MESCLPSSLRGLVEIVFHHQFMFYFFFFSEEIELTNKLEHILVEMVDEVLRFELASKYESKKA